MRRHDAAAAPDRVFHPQRCCIAALSLHLPVVPALRNSKALMCASARPSALIAQTPSTPHTTRSHSVPARTPPGLGFYFPLPTDLTEPMGSDLHCFYVCEHFLTRMRMEALGRSGDRAVGGKITDLRQSVGRRCQSGICALES